MSVLTFVCMHLDQSCATDTSQNGIIGVAARPMLRTPKRIKERKVRGKSSHDNVNPHTEHEKCEYEDALTRCTWRKE